jgi:hypothetical protein
LIATGAQGFNVPDGNITIKGELELTNTASYLTVGTSKKLDITLPSASNVSLFSGAGEVKATIAGDIVTITDGGVAYPGYRLDATGVEASLLDGAVRALRGVIVKLATTIPSVEPGWGITEAVFGTVAITNSTGAAPITFEDDGNPTPLSSQYIPPGVTAVASSATASSNSDVSATVVTVVKTTGGDPLGVVDTGYGGATDEYTVITFAGPRFVHSNLTSPVAPNFKVAVKTSR